MAALTTNTTDLDLIYRVPKNIFPKKRTEIQNFYSKKNILITGATGFLGKLLVEKLLWSCPDIGNIYIMLRQKKGKDSISRIDDLLNTPAFSRLKRDQPLFKDKIKTINGDCELSGLGLSSADREEIIEEVNIIFHVAASVRFHEPLTTALNINLRATQDLVELSKEMKGLKVFMHVSTAYCQCYSSTLDERFYETPMDPIKLLKFLESSDKKIIDEISPKLLGKWPNTYTFSKALTEDYIRQSAVGMPIGIFRPSIVVSSVNEPVPRWVDNWYGVSGFITACSAGLLRSMTGKSDAEANLVPVDMCVNAMIASAWDVHERYKLQKPLEKPSARDIQIYNYVLTDKTITWGKFYNLVCEGGIKYPPSKALWYHSLTMNMNPIRIFLNKIFLHYVPGLILDAFSVCTGQKPQIIKMYNRIHKMNGVTEFFTTKCWNFSNHNMLKVQAKMSDEDRKLYECDLKKIDWNDYLNGYFLGIRRYLMKDEDSTLVSAKRKYAVLYWMDKFVKIILFMNLLRGMYRTGKIIQNRFIK